MSNGRKPPNPQNFPRDHGRKPSAPKVRKGKSVLSGDSSGSGCAVTAIAMVAGAAGVVSAAGYGIAQLF